MYAAFKTDSVGFFLHQEEYLTAANAPALLVRVRNEWPDEEGVVIALLSDFRKVVPQPDKLEDFVPHA